jgi:hypothetical protein
MKLPLAVFFCCIFICFFISLLVYVRYITEIAFSSVFSCIFICFFDLSPTYITKFAFASVFLLHFHLLFNFSHTINAEYFESFFPFLSFSEVSNQKTFFGQFLCQRTSGLAVADMSIFPLADKRTSGSGLDISGKLAE